MYRYLPLYTAYFLVSQRQTVAVRTVILIDDHQLRITYKKDYLIVKLPVG